MSQIYTLIEGLLGNSSPAMRTVKTPDGLDLSLSKAHSGKLKGMRAMLHGKSVNQNIDIGIYKKPSEKNQPDEYSIQACDYKDNNGQVTISWRKNADAKVDITPEEALRIVPEIETILSLLSDTASLQMQKRQ